MADETIAIVPIRSHEVARLWDALAPVLEPAVERADGAIACDDVRRALECRDMQLWCASVDGRFRAAIVTELVNHPRKRVCVVLFVAGAGLKQWLPAAMDTIGGWARANGCAALDTYGRKGLVRALAGWTPVMTVMRSKL